MKFFHHPFTFKIHPPHLMYPFLCPNQLVTIFSLAGREKIITRAFETSRLLISHPPPLTGLIFSPQHTTTMAKSDSRPPLPKGRPAYHRRASHRFVPKAASSCLVQIPLFPLLQHDGCRRPPPRFHRCLLQLLSTQEKSFP